MPDVRIPAEGVILSGQLDPAGADDALVIFAHGSGSSRRSPRNRAVAQAIRSAGMSTLLFDLLTEEEDVLDRETARLRFDVHLLADRLQAATEWAVAQHVDSQGVSIGYFGASTGAAAALIAAAALGERVSAVVSRGGRPDLAGARRLALVVSPTLLIVGGNDPEVIVLNEHAAALRQGHRDRQRRLAPVRGAGRPRPRRALRDRLVPQAPATRRGRGSGHRAAPWARGPAALMHVAPRSKLPCVNL